MMNESSNKALLKEYLMRAFKFSLTGFNDLDEESTLQNEDSKRRFSHIMLTISGIEMRAVVLLHYPVGAEGLQLLNYLKSLDHSRVQHGEVDAFFMEMGNQLCGEVKRYLYTQFNHTGMSTPLSISDTTLLSDIVDKTLIEKSDYFLSLHGKPVLGGSIYLFSLDSLILNFEISAMPAELTTGEIEFF